MTAANAFIIICQIIAIALGLFFFLDSILSTTANILQQMYTRSEMITALLCFCWATLLTIAYRISRIGTPH